MFDPAKCSSRGCLQKFILSKVSSHKNLAKKSEKMTMTIAIGNGSTNMELSMPSRTSLMNSFLVVAVALFFLFVA